jgi:hypothetical protein
MTRDEILKMKYGPELDALVAEKVFKYWNVEMYEGKLVHGENNMNGWPVVTPHYSTEISAAWKVVENNFMTGTQELRIGARGKAFQFTCYHNGNKGEAVAETAPLAICRAALLAVSEEKP